MWKNSLRNTASKTRCSVSKKFTGIQTPKCSKVTLLKLIRSSKYKLFESQFESSKASMRTKLPEIKNAIGILDFLQKNTNNDLKTHFNLADTVHAKGRIPAGLKTVKLWLGANIMVEYSFEEARTLLKKNLDNATQNIVSLVNLHFEWKKKGRNDWEGVGCFEVAVLKGMEGVG